MNKEELVMSKGLLVLVSALFLTACSGTVDEAIDQANDLTEKDIDAVVTNVEERIDEVEQGIDQLLIDEGERAVINSSAFVAYERDAFEEIYDIHGLDNHDAEYYQELIDDNKIKMLEEGTEVQVLEVDFTEAKVKVNDTGNTAFIHSSLLTQTSS